MSHPPAEPSLEATAADHEARLLQLEALLDEAGAEALILGQAGNAAWSLCGADLRIQVSSERTWGYVVVRRGVRKVVTWVMDARRFAEEELPRDVEAIALQPDEGSLEAVALDLAGGGRVLSDCELPGTEPALDHLRRVQYPLAGQRERYAHNGYPDAWRDHWQGGQTGFALCEIAHTTRPHEAIPERGLYNWFITLPGVKKEETTLSTSEGGRILTLTGAWPTRMVDTDLGAVTVAELYVR